MKWQGREQSSNIEDRRSQGGGGLGGGGFGGGFNPNSFGNGGGIRVGTPQEIATEVSINTAFGVERVVRFAFETAQARPAKKLTLVHKTNVLVNAGSLWQRTVDAVSTEYPEIAVDYLHVDAATIFMVTKPSRFDVIVTDNLFGDIITDLAAAISGGIGLAASGNINPDGAFPSMFEPVHGSAPDIAGQHLADPTAAILSVALLLGSLGLGDHMNKRPDQLSGGQRQRVAVARALANEPPVILADEPTGSLDSKASEQVFEVLRDLVRVQGKTVVAVTHDLGMAERMDRHIELLDGRLRADEMHQLANKVSS